MKKKGGIRYVNKVGIFIGRVKYYRQWVRYLPAVTANDVILSSETGIGDASNLLTLDINRLDADNRSSNGIFISNTKALTLSDLDQNVHAILNESNADIVVETLEGHLTIAQTVKGYSDILLSSESDTASITIEGSILTNQGNVSILADTDINQSATIISGGTVDIYAENGSITMADNYSTIAQGDNIRYQAKGDIVIENINAGPKDVCIYSETGNVYATSDTDHANITAANVRIDSANAIGTHTNHLNTLTDTLAVKASGHIYVSDHSSVTIDQVDSQAIQRVQRDGSTLTVVQDESQLTGLVCNKEGANIVIQTLNGDLTINAFESTIGNGNIRLFAGSGNIILKDQIASGTGHLSIIAEKSIMQNADILISGGTIDVSATDHISMNSGVVTQTLGNNILYESLQGNITINEINAKQGIVGIVAENGNISFLDNDASENIISQGLILHSGGLIDPVKTDVSVLTAMAGGDLIVENTHADGVSIDEITLAVNRIESDGATPKTSETFKFSDLTTKNNGAIVLNAAGSITVNDGDSDTIAIDASSGSGNILLQSTTDEISIQSIVDAGSGSISMIAGSHITLGDSDNTQSHILTSGDGTIDIQAKGNITISDGNMVSADANIRMFADEVLTIGEIKANGGSVSLTARDISDSDIKLPDESEDIDIIAENLILKSDLGAGVENRLDISVDTLSADVNFSGLFIHEVDGLHIDDVGEIKVNRVGLDGHLSENEIGDTIEAGIRSQGAVDIMVDSGDFIQSAKIISDGRVSIYYISFFILFWKSNFKLVCQLIRGVSNGWGKQKPESNLWSRSNVGSNLMFALEQKPVSDLWSRIYMNRSPSGIGSISVSVRGRTQGSPPTFIFGHSLKKYTITDLSPINWIRPHTTDLEFVNPTKCEE